MLKKMYYPALAAVVAYSAFILSEYGSSYPESAGFAEFAGFVFVVIGGKLLFVAALAVSAYGYAGLVPARWSAVFGSMMEEGLIRTSLGLIIISYIMFALGLAGLLYRPVGYLVLAGGMLAGYRDLPGFARRIAALPRTVDLNFKNVLLLSVSAYFLIAGLYAALLPPTGFDVLMYHLGVPRMYIDAHSIFPTPDVNGSAFPFGIEMLYMLGMMTGGAIAANVVNYGFAVMGGVAAAAFSRRFVEGSSGLAAFTVYVSIPMVFWLMPQAYIELAQAAYGMVAVYAVAVWSRGRDKGWLYAAAALTGYSMSIKYTGGIVVGVLTLAVLANLAFVERSGMKKALAVTAVFAFVAAVVSAPWYIKNIVQTGNPVYPFLAGAFGQAAETTQVQGAGHVSGGIAGAAAGFVRSLWGTTFDAGAYQMAWANGLGPALLMLIPAGALFGKPRREVALLMLYCLAFYVVLFFRLEGSYIAQHLGNLRYAAPILPALAVLATYPLDRISAGVTLPEKAAGRVLVVLLSVGVLMAAVPRTSVETFPSASPRATDEYYSKGQWSGFLASYDVWKWIGANIPKDATIYQLWDDASVYFRNRDTIGFALPMGEHGRNKLHYVADPIGRFDHNRGFLPGESIISNLRKMGADYLLVNANREGHSVPSDSFFNGHAELIVNHRGVYLYRLNYMDTP